MKKTTKLLILIILSLSVYFIYQNTKSNNIKVLNIGDKLSQGINSYGIKEYGFIDHYKDYLKSPTKKIAIVNKYSKKDLTIRELTNQIKNNATLKRDLLEAHILFLTIGYNDLIYKLSLEEKVTNKTIKKIMKETVEEYNDLIKEIRKYYKKEIICIGYYKPNKKNIILNLGIKNLNFYLESQQEVIYINTYKLLKDKKTYFSNPNSYYPNKIGYKKIFQGIIQQTKKDLKS